jgi:hypothetical protein
MFVGGARDRPRHDFRADAGIPSPPENRCALERVLQNALGNQETAVMCRRLMPMFVCFVLVAMLPVRASFAQKVRDAKNPPKATGTKAGERPVSMVELRKLFDAYVTTQAEEQLKINKAQLPKFLEQYKGLRDSRRMAAEEHNRLLVELRQHAADAKVSETQLKDRLKALRAVEERAHGDVRKAYDEIDKLLDVRQQAQFRVFEVQMDRRMAQVVARARQANGAKAVK